MKRVLAVMGPTKLIFGRKIALPYRWGFAGHLNNANTYNLGLAKGICGAWLYNTSPDQVFCPRRLLQYEISALNKGVPNVSLYNTWLIRSSEPSHALQSEVNARQYVPTADTSNLGPTSRLY